MSEDYMHAANDSLSMLVVQDRTKKVSEQASKQGSYFGQKEDKLEDLPPLPKSDKTSGTGQKCTEACGKGPNAVFLGCKSALLLNSRLIIPTYVSGLLAVSAYVTTQCIACRGSSSTFVHRIYEVCLFA